MTNLASSENSKLKEFLRERGVAFISDIRASHVPPIDFALFLQADAIGERAEKNQTSWRQLRQLQIDIKKRLGITVEWIVIPGTQAASLEGALLEILQQRFPGVFAAVFVSSPKLSPVWVWLDVKPDAKDLPDIKTLEVISTELFKIFGFVAPHVVYASATALPTNLAILRALKIRAPAHVEELFGVLTKRQSSIPDIRWLQTKLDTMRKTGLVVRAGTGQYVLTERALAIVPINKKRSSSDVERALALGRARW
jgi:hypothetical protein